MTQFTPAVEAALQADTPLVAGILKIVLPEATIRLLDGAGSIVVDGETYSGEDPVFGSLAAVGEITDGIGDEAPAISFTLHPASDAATADLAGPLMQGSLVTLSLVAINRETGAIIPDPLDLFVGELDQPILSVDKGVRELEYECVSGMEKLFENQEGVRLADSWHQAVWPDELGLENVTAIIRTIYWGVHAPAGAISAAPGGFGFDAGFNIPATF
jgi:hypothetical protein